MPREHGAWAFLTAPILVGGLVGGWSLHQLPLALTAVAAYLTFNAATWWAKMPPRRRGDTVEPLVGYGAATAVGGLVVGSLAGWQVIGWLVVLCLPLVLSWWLAKRGQVRSLLSGLSTALSAALLSMVAARPDIVAFVAHPDPAVAVAALITFGYLGGTVFTVKSVIRERGSTPWMMASVSWHAAWALATGAGALFGALTPVWAGFFAFDTVRCTVMPLAAKRRPVRPLVVGLVEIGFTVALLALFAFAPLWV